MPRFHMRMAICPPCLEPGSGLELASEGFASSLASDMGAMRIRGAPPDAAGSMAWNSAWFGKLVALFDSVESTPWNGARFGVNMALLHAVESTPWNGASFAVFAALFDSVESTLWNAAERNSSLAPFISSRRTAPFHDGDPDVRRRCDAAFARYAGCHLGLRLRTDTLPTRAIKLFRPALGHDNGH